MRLNRHTPSCVRCPTLRAKPTDEESVGRDAKMWELELERCGEQSHRSSEVDIGKVSVEEPGEIFKTLKIKQKQVGRTF